MSEPSLQGLMDTIRRMEMDEKATIMKQKSLPTKINREDKLDKCRRQLRECRTSNLQMAQLLRSNESFINQLEEELRIMEEKLNNCETDKESINSELRRCIENLQKRKRG